MPRGEKQLDPFHNLLAVGGGADLAMNARFCAEMAAKYAIAAESSDIALILGESSKNPWSGDSINDEAIEVLMRAIITFGPMP